MSIEVPAQALEEVQNALSYMHRTPNAANGVFRMGDIRQLAQFVAHFSRFPLKGMETAIVGEDARITITDEAIDATRLDLIKINGTNFLPEMDRGATMHIPGATDLYRRMLAECAVRFRDEESIYRAKAKVASNLSNYSSEAERRTDYDQANDKAERNASIAARIETLLEGLDEPAPELPADVVALVNAGRTIWENLESYSISSPYEVSALDKALEAFASRVPYDDEPGHCSCGAEDAPPSEHDLSCPETVPDTPRSFFGKPVEVDRWWEGPEWGEPVTFKGAPAEWVKADGRRAISAGDLSEGASMCAHTYYLPAEHPYYLATSRGFEYWPGGDEAPKDWDSSRFVLFRNGSSYQGRLWRWDHRRENPSDDIIGYHKLPSATISTQAATIGSGATVNPEDVASLETKVTFGGHVLNTFEERQRAEKIDRFAMGANNRDIDAHMKWEGMEPVGTREQARYDFAFAMMAERARRGLK